MTKTFRKIIAAAGLAIILTLSLSSCHREGCPNKIVQATSAGPDWQA